MRIRYDPGVDIVYIRLMEGERVSRTVQFNDNVLLHIGPGETLVKVEILNATEVLGRGETPTVVLENLSIASES